ncbi:RCC1 domain-containing protein [Bdellovibrio reynosensis]|uniref:Uncharacterized protein n=1 Tax=Bdellovibrio reynosensis TaxID=2835041 RepID=A0ABY4C9K4_9BACT|nr:hypothetical protein [Bdellovibrio reynosensis]UOF01459.1 hypothetical protein MNR06_00640 [Bdellovibrio reynosensis]
MEQLNVNDVLGTMNKAAYYKHSSIKFVSLLTKGIHFLTGISFCILSGCSLDIALISSEQGAASLIWNQDAFDNGELKAEWTPADSEKVVEQELLYYKGPTCDEPILPSVKLSPDQKTNVASFTKTDGTQYSFKVFSLDKNGISSASNCSNPITYKAGFTVHGPANGFINSSNYSAAGFSGKCVVGSQIEVALPNSASFTSFNCGTENWSQSIDLSSLAPIYSGNLIFKVTPPSAQAKEYSLTIYKDIVIPLVAITSSTPINLLNHSSYAVSGTCSEDGKSVIISVGAVSETATCSGGAFTKVLDISGTTVSPVNIMATHKDAVENVETDTASVTLDISPPTVTSFLINNGDVATASVNSILSMNVAEATEMYLTNTPGCTAGGTWQSYVNSLAWTLPSANGVNTVYAKFKDVNGNESLCISDDISISTPPTIAFTTPAAGAYVNLSNVASFTVGGTCSENNQSITFTGPGGFTGTATCLGSSFTAILNLTPVPQGNFQLTATISNSFGTSTSVTSPVYTKDTVAPTGTVIINANQTDTISLTVTLSVNSIVGSQIYITNTPGCAADGTWVTANFLSKSWTLNTPDAVNTVFVKYKDAAGNETPCYSDSISHSSVVPTVSLSSPVSGSYINIATGTSVTLSGGCSEEGKNVTISISTFSALTAVCTAGSWSKTFNFSAKADQTYSVNITHSRSTGVNATPVTASYIKDTTAPTITGFSINNGTAVTSSQNATLNVTSHTGTETYVTNNALCLTGGTWEPVSFPKAWTLPTLNSTNTVYIKLRDAAGNESSCVSDFIIHDNTVPTLSITEPPAGTFINQYSAASFDVKGTCSAHGQIIYGVVTGEPSVGTSAAYCTGGYFTLHFNVSSLSDTSTTPYDFELSLTAANGNSVNTTSYYYMDATLPSAVSISGAPSGTNNSTGLNVTVSSATASFYKYFLIPPGGTGSCAISSAYIGTKYPVSTPITDLLTETGNYTLCVVGIDDHDNWSTAATTASWTRDAIKSTLSGAPTGVVTTTALNISVAGTNVTQYKYAIISTGGCATASFVGPVAVGSNITDNISALPNGPVKVCVIGGDASNNWQEVSVATETSWIKDSIVTLNISSAAVNRVSEGDTKTITFSMSGSKTFDVTAYFKITGDATSTEHNLTSGSITIPAGSTTANLPVNFLVNAATTGETLMNVHLTHTDSPAVLLDPKYQAQYFIRDSQKDLTTISLAINFYHACAVLDDNSLRCWGHSGVNLSRLGLGNTVGFADTAKTVAPGISFKSVTAGRDHTCALTTSGYVYCWGENLSNQIGDGTTARRTTPVLIDSSTTYTSISSGQAHTCGITTEQKLKCWGSADSYQTGLNTTSSAQTPTQVTSADFKFVSANSKTTCAIDTNDKLFCWGRNATGTVGDGTLIVKQVPTAIDSSNTYLMVAVGSGHSCGIISDGTLKCWGNNSQGQLGDNTLVTKTSPTVINSAVKYSWVTVNDDTTTDTNRGFSCGITDGGVLHCWGNNAGKQLADGTTTNRKIPTIADSGESYSRVYAVSQKACGITTAGAVKCWGNLYKDNTTGRNSDLYGFGYGTYLGAYGGSFFALSDYNFKTIGMPDSAADTSSQTCGITGNKLYCWGETSYFGDGLTYRRPAPVILDAQNNYSQVSEMHDSSNNCAITSTGTLKCWGRNNYGELGSAGNIGTNIFTPKVADPTTSYSQIFLRLGAACGITTTGALRCAGNNNFAKLGDGTTTHITNFTTIDSGVSYKQIGIGTAFSCGLTTSNKVRCWGTNTYGQLGTGNLNNSYTPIDTDPSESYRSISVGLDRTCGITMANKLKCWGNGLLGDNGAGDPKTPHVIDSASDYSSVTVNNSVACAIKTNGSTKCWGANTGVSLPSESGSAAQYNILIDYESQIAYSKIYLSGSSLCGLTPGGLYRCAGKGAGGVFGMVDPNQTYISNVLTVTAPVYIQKWLSY